MDSRYLLSSFRYRSHGLLYVQVSIIFFSLSFFDYHTFSQEQESGSGRGRKQVSHLVLGWWYN